jgi:hypothetical protein
MRWSRESAFIVTSLYGKKLEPDPFVQPDSAVVAFHDL